MRRIQSIVRPCLAPVALAGLAMAGCDGGGTGSVQFFAEPEETIPEGLEPGTGDENLVDGWRVTYQKFLVTIGNVRATRSSSPGEALADPKSTVIDLRSAPAGGVVIARFDDVAAVRWDKVGFDLPRATAASGKAAGLAQADYDRMVQSGYSVYVEGTAEKADGQSCKPTMPMDCVERKTVKFAFGLDRGTAFDDCAPAEGDAGFAVPAGGTAQVKPTIHGDHWFFTNVTQGAEITERRAQWLADADLDRDGNTTIEELKMIRASDLMRAPTYNLSGALIPIETAWDYVAAQIHTLGDFQGDGECPTRRVLP